MVGRSANMADCQHTNNHNHNHNHNHDHRQARGGGEMYDQDYATTPSTSSNTYNCVSHNADLIAASISTSTPTLSTHIPLPATDLHTESRNVIIPFSDQDKSTGTTDNSSRCARSTLASLQCCCGRRDCAYLEHNNVALGDLEKDLETAARLGQVRLLLLFFLLLLLLLLLPLLLPFVLTMGNASSAITGCNHWLQSCR